LPVTLLAAGLVFLVLNELIKLGDLAAVDVFGPLVFGNAAATVAIAAGAVSTTDTDSREMLATTAATVQLLALAGAYGWKDADQLGPHMAVMVPATLLLLGAIALGLRSHSQTAKEAPA